jgi:hypothetical protein
MHIASRHVGRMTKLGRVPSLAAALFIGPLAAVATAQQSEDCEHLELTQRSIRLAGSFTAERPEKFYCFFARRGQQARIRIVPQTADLNTQDNLRFPHGDLEPGGPGGLIFDEQLPEDGLYRLRIGQRFGEKKAGQFDLIIKLDGRKK